MSFRISFKEILKSASNAGLPCSEISADVRTLTSLMADILTDS